MYRLIAILIGYALGSIQTAYFMGRLHGIDIREHGSKNAGMTNVTRTLSKRAGFFVFVVDLLKGAAAFLITAHFFGHTAGLYAGLGSVLGHCFPVWLKFRGGKGVSCAVAVILVMDWRTALISFAFGILVVATTRYISLASLVVLSAAPVAMFFLGHNIEAVAVMAITATLIWYMHRENIKRLRSGTESKFLAKKE